jgi:Conserved in the green lineage and diatoms 27
MKSSSSVCPVPEEQRPVNEYRTLADSWFFRWAALKGFGYWKPIALLWVISVVITGPVAAASYRPDRHPIAFTFLAATNACILPALALTRLYLGWGYVRQRLLDVKVFYEESGWYDGQIWQKTPEVLNQDRLIVSYEIQPLLQRMQMTLGVMAAVCVAGAVAWILL